MIHKLFLSILEQDPAPIVVCDTESIIRYMNPSAIRHYHKDLTGCNVKDCHNNASNEKIDKVLSWFQKSRDNNCVYTYHSDKENKDVYMIALRDGDGTLMGYYEKHAYRDRETKAMYEM